MNSLIPAEFHGTPITLIEIDGKKWLTAEQAGHCLGYSADYAGKSIITLYNRNADEFTVADTCVVNLTTQGQDRDGFGINLIPNPLGGNPNARIFSETGCNKLGFLAQTPRAKEFRDWAAQTLAGQPAPLPPVAAPPVAAPTSLETNMATLAGHMGEMAAGMKTVVTQLDVTRRYIDMLEKNQAGVVRITPTIKAHVHTLKAQGLNNSEIARTLRIGRASVSLIVNGKYPETNVTDDAPPTVAEKIDTWIAREQLHLCETLDGLGTRGGAA